MDSDVLSVVKQCCASPVLGRCRWTPLREYLTSVYATKPRVHYAAKGLDEVQQGRQHYTIQMQLRGCMLLLPSQMKRYVPDVLNAIVKKLD